jgi:myo-inositol-1(or 4)-monophosphatase
MTNTAFLDTLIDTASQAARQAGDYALTQMGQVQASVKRGPTGEELVTEVDRRCQSLIVDAIRSRFPDHGFIGEEGDGGGLFKQPPTGADAVWWIIDPIDGTNNFALGLGIFAVSIGAMIHGRPVAGVIYCPFTNTLFTGRRDAPPRLNGQPVTCGSDAIGLFTCVALDSHFGSTVPPWLNQLMLRCRFRSLGAAALHLSYVSSGALAGAVISLPKLWDIAAGAVLIEGSGARITNWQGASLWPLDLAEYDGHKLPCVAANPTAHQEIMTLMHETS